MSNKILVLSLNSHLKHTVWTELSYDSHTDMQYEKYTAVGSGLNICRALAAYGTRTLPILLIGEENAKHYSELMLNYGITDYRQVLAPGSVAIVTDNIDSKGNITSELTPATAVYTENIQQIVDTAKAELVKDAFVIISGTLPEHISSDQLCYIASELSNTGANLVLDTMEFSLKQMFSLKPWCIKLNLQNLEILSGKSLTNTEDIMSLCTHMCHNGAHHCIVSSGAEGLYYCSKDEAFIVQVPRIDVHGEEGAGDMVTAGFMYSILNNRNKLKRSLCVAAAFGTAACLTDGINPPQKLSFASILGRVRIKQYMCGIVK